MQLRSHLCRLGAREIAGYAIDPSAPDRMLVVEILVDDIVFATVRADRRMPDLEAAAGHGFCVALAEDVLGDTCTVEARLANLGTPVGETIAIGPGAGADDARIDPGEVEWHGGLRIAGWSTDAADEPLSILVDGVLVEHLRPTRWRNVDRCGESQAVRAFATHLPPSFADGQVHACAVLTGKGEELRGSPAPFWAFADGLRSAVAGGGLSERDHRRAELFDSMVPASLPFSAEEALEPDPPAGDPAPATRFLVVLVGPDPAAAESIESLHRQTHAEWTTAKLPSGTGPTAFAPAGLRRVLDETHENDVVVFALAGTFFRASALREIAAAFAAHPTAALVYADIDVQGADGSLWPLALPALDYERLLEQGYCTLVFAMRGSALTRAVSAQPADLPRLVMALFEGGGPGPQVVHRPGVLATLPAFDRHAASRTLAASAAAHLAARGVEAAVDVDGPGVLPAVRVRRVPLRTMRTTILIPTRNRRDLLEACLGSMRPAARRHGADVIVIDNGSSDPDALAYLARLPGDGIGVITDPGPFNFARLINRGAERARGEALCLLNNDVVARDANWLGELLGRLADDDVGAAAPLLAWPSGVVQHGGLVLGPCFEAASAFTDRLDGDPGYADMLRVARECSAVSAACLLTRRRDFIDLGGMDELNFPINYNDVDYCLKLREAGRRIVFTPHARLLHAESSSRGRSWSPDRRSLFQRERRHLQLKWGEAIAHDPYYSPLLTLGPQPFSGLAAPVRPHGPRLNRAPVARDIPEGAS